MAKLTNTVFIHMQALGFKVAAPENGAGCHTGKVGLTVRYGYPHS